jgi:hypothetical protein
MNTGKHDPHRVESGLDGRRGNSGKPITAWIRGTGRLRTRADLLDKLFDSAHERLGRNDIPIYIENQGFAPSRDGFSDRRCLDRVSLSAAHPALGST